MSERKGKQHPPSSRVHLRAAREKLNAAKRHSIHLYERGEFGIHRDTLEHIHKAFGKLKEEAKPPGEKYDKERETSTGFHTAEGVYKEHKARFTHKHDEGEYEPPKHSDTIDKMRKFLSKALRAIIESEFDRLESSGGAHEWIQAQHEVKRLFHEFDQAKKEHGQVVEPREGTGKKGGKRGKRKHKRGTAAAPLAPAPAPAQAFLRFGAYPRI